jgi:hypothetical protein
MRRCRDQENPNEEQTTTVTPISNTSFRRSVDAIDSPAKSCESCYIYTHSSAHQKPKRNQEPTPRSAKQQKNTGVETRWKSPCCSSLNKKIRPFSATKKKRSSCQDQNDRSQIQQSFPSTLVQGGLIHDDKSCVQDIVAKERQEDAEAVCV